MPSSPAIRRILGACQRNSVLQACLLLGTWMGPGQAVQAQPAIEAEDTETLQVDAEFVAGEESAALEALREAERLLFGALLESNQQGLEDGSALSQELRVGVPPALTSDLPAQVPSALDSGAPVHWIHGLNDPDLPIQWRAPVVRYLEYFRDSRRGRRLMRGWARRAGRYGAMIQQTLREEGLPEDLRCVAMAESGFDPTVRSRRGAVGMWQFVAVTGREYGLHADRWIDERMDPVASTRAAARFLGDLHRRLGRWELALAAYNMGYTALLRAIRKYNTNDYWTLASLEAGLPFETTIYVAKIMACSVVMRNPERFGLGDTEVDSPLAVESFRIGGGVNLGQLARAARVDRATLATLNPQLRRGRTPPGRTTTIHIPAGQHDAFARAWSRLRARDQTHQVHVFRFGETARSIARRYRMTVGSLRQVNGIESDERILPGTALLVDARPPQEDAEEEAPLVVVPAERFHYPNRRRIFYRVLGPDTVEEIARFFQVHTQDLRRWNGLDREATLHADMFLQLFVEEGLDLAHALVLSEGEAEVVALGSEAFFNSREERRGRVRFFYTVREGDTLSALGRRFGLSVGSIARINQFSRRTDLVPGQQVIIYTDPEHAPRAATPAPVTDGPAASPETDGDENAAEASPSEAPEEETEEQEAAGTESEGAPQEGTDSENADSEDASPETVPESTDTPGASDAEQSEQNTPEEATGNPTSEEDSEASSGENAPASPAPSGEAEREPAAEEPSNAGPTVEGVSNTDSPD